MYHHHSYHFGLIGWPVDHSLSPGLHRAALFEAGLEGDYQLVPIPPGPNCESTMIGILRFIRSGELDGLNVTIPYKQTVIPLVDRISKNALAIGAVNTILLQQGQLVGDNTDSIGFGQDLMDAGIDYQHNPGQALVLGAGGAARAVIYTLACAGWKIFIAARRFAQADEVSHSINRALPEAQLFPMELSRSSLQQISARMKLIVNTTPLGMNPEVKKSVWPDGLPFSHSTFVYDLVYRPKETVFLQSARLSGCATRNGLGMLVNQAAAAFELWTGHDCSRKVLWDSINSIDIRAETEG